MAVMQLSRSPRLFPIAVLLLILACVIFPLVVCVLRLSEFYREHRSEGEAFWCTDVLLGFRYVDIHVIYDSEGKVTRKRIGSFWRTKARSCSERSSGAVNSIVVGLRMPVFGQAADLPKWKQ